MLEPLYMHDKLAERTAGPKATVRTVGPADWLLRTASMLTRRSLASTIERECLISSRACGETDLISAGPTVNNSAGPTVHSRAGPS